MLRSIRELDRFRVAAGDGKTCGRLRDIYFDDLSWTVRYLVVSTGTGQFGQKQRLVDPDHVAAIWEDESIIHLRLESHELENLPPASAALPVCKQYAALAYASPGARTLAGSVAGADPHLRSVRAVMSYHINVAGEFGGTLSDFLFDDEAWEIRYLGVQQVIERKKLNFYVLPQSVERFTWATQRVVLRDLQPVALEAAHVPLPAFNASAA